MADMVLVPRTDWVAALDAVREKGGTAAAMTSGQLAPAIAAISGGDLPRLLDGSLTVCRDGGITALRDYALFAAYGLTAVDFPKVTSVGEHAFENCSALTQAALPAVRELGVSAFFYSGLTAFSGPELVRTGTYAFGRCAQLAALEAPRLQDIGDHSFYHCDRLTAVVLPELLTLGPQGFRRCGALKKAEFAKVTAIGAEALSTTALDTLILRTPAVCTLENADALLETPIAAGTGWIYVPRALAEQYKAAANWSTYAARIRAIEDYPTETGG